MFNSPKTRRTAIDGFLWIVIAFCIWFLLTRHFVAFFAVSGRWQMPGISRVYVGHVQHDSNDAFKDVLITVNKDGSQEVSRLLKEELIGVQPGDTIWLIHTPYVTVTSPPSYRLTFFRLITEFPEIFLLISGCWLFFRFRNHLGKPFDAYEGPKKATVTYVIPSPDSWGRSKLLIKNKDQDKNP
jgi:hypothetical protein